MKTIGTGCRIKRETRGALSHRYGKDRGRLIVLELCEGDLIQLTPKGTRQRVTISVHDVYQYAIRTRANAVNLAKARRRKLTIAEARTKADNARTTRILKRQAKERGGK